jgi:hypothetical protein
MTDALDALTELVRDSFRGTDLFRPFACYNHSLDMIEIQVRDCSYVELPQDDSVSVLEDNYPEPATGRQIGLLIHHAQGFCRAHQLSVSRGVALDTLFEAVICSIPGLRDTIERLAGHFPEGAVVDVNLGR